MRASAHDARATSTANRPQGRLAPPSESPFDLQWGLSPSDQRVLAVLLTLLVALLAVHWYRLSRQALSPIVVHRPASTDTLYRIDINTAGWVEWAQLDGIGEKLGQRLVAHRQQHGPFRTVEDLLAVKGIGPKTLEKLRPHLTNIADAKPDDP